MNKFKIGDVVVCTIPKDRLPDFDLKKNKEYVVGNIRQEKYIVFKDSMYGYKINRFKLAKKHITLSRYLTT